ncbi:uncharacterized protein K489DRAFT_372544 [Dissoconium aciculare CBS 342.82]|uniref:Uncharacterized protein n=1 Tax=Dissoconium aciculare CBS 342.82 TaxID=1314786 RepID=A0A6J3M1L9_9PEZI|nr:uncharacterized protein K489DRAFT_372544 [Dissoconium aciculare CBS 342.82]KAF1820812.1 hypothetical protein K489DRAFT_372544 [Dissoconium aciculare CBS 342.82]
MQLGMIVAPHGPSTAVEIHMRHAPLTNAARRRECQLESCELQGEQELEPLATAHDVVQCMSIVLRRDGNAEHHDGGLAPSLIAKEKKEAAARIDPRSKASVEKGERDLPACISPVSGQHKRASQPAAHARGPKQRASMSAQNCNRPRVDSNSTSTDDCARLLLPLRRKTPPPPAVTGDNERSAKEQTDARGPLSILSKLVCLGNTNLTYLDNRGGAPARSPASAATAACYARLASLVHSLSNLT